VSELVGSVFMGIADIITDGIAYTSLASGEAVFANGQYETAYLAILIFGVVTTTVALAYRLSNAQLVRATLLELVAAGKQSRTVSASEAQRQVQKHEFEMVQTHRTKVILSLSLLSVVAQGASLL
jgi:hypothetical protein